MTPIAYCPLCSKPAIPQTDGICWRWECTVCHFEGPWHAALKDADKDVTWR